MKAGSGAAAAGRPREEVLRATIVGLMAGCLAISPVALVESTAGSWDGAFLVWLCTLVAAEGYLSTSALHRLRRILGPRRLGLQLVELGGLFAVSQLAADISGGNVPFEGWTPHLDAASLTVFGPSLAAWLVGASTSRLFSALDSSDGAPFSPPLKSLARRFLTGGLLLCFAAALTQPRIADLMHLPHGVAPGPVLHVLLYFVLGAILLTHGRFAALRQQWRMQRVDISAELGRRWLGYSLVLVAAAGILALLVPTDQVGILAGHGQGAWTELGSLLTGVWQHFSSLFKPSSRPVVIPTILPRNITPPPLPPPVHHPSPVHAPHTGGGRDWTGLLKLVLFWGLVAAGMGWLLREWVRRALRRGSLFAGRRSRFALHPSRFLAWLRQLRLGTAMASLRQALKRNLIRLARTATRRIAHGAQRTANSDAQRAPGTANRTWLRPRRATTPREQVMRYYLDVISQAERAGVGRRPWQTPREFDARIGPRLGEEARAMNSLTEAFIEARYSPHPVEELQATRAKRWAERIRGALRAKPAS